MQMISDDMNDPPSKISSLSPLLGLINESDRLMSNYDAKGGCETQAVDF